MAIKRDDYLNELARIRAEQNAYAAQNNPGSYQNQYGQQTNDALTAYTNRQPFQYDAHSDALYQALRGTAVREGRRASADVMGQAAQLTGGYGNSYAASAAAQAYQNRLAQLANSIPELAQFAANRYEQEGNALLERYNMYRNAENDNYNRYLNALNNYNANMSRYDTLAANARSAAENQYQYDTNREWQQQQFDYQREQDAIANSQKWASMAQSNSEAALKAQIADLKGQLEGYEKKSETLPLSNNVKKEIFDELRNNRYSVDEAIRFVGSKYGKKGYDEDEIMDYIDELYNRNSRLNKPVSLVNNALKELGF